MLAVYLLIRGKPTPAVTATYTPSVGTAMPTRMAVVYFIHARAAAIHASSGYPDRHARAYALDRATPWITP